MTTPSHSSQSQICTIEAPSVSQVGGLSLDHYLREANQKVDEIAGCLRHGEPVPPETRDWMLAQVEFVVDVIGAENMELDQEMRSRLLELLLSIANLNEHIRAETSRSLQNS
jgi:hypothetical protein